MSGPCELCGGELGILGILGNRVHLSCRACGMAYSREQTAEDDLGVETEEIDEEAFAETVDEEDYTLTEEG